MNKQIFPVMLLIVLSIISCTKMGVNNNDASLQKNTASQLQGQLALAALPAGSPVVNLPLTNFANAANEVVLFEGTAWEMADSVIVHLGLAKGL